MIAQSHQLHSLNKSLDLFNLILGENLRENSESSTLMTIVRDLFCHSFPPGSIEESGDNVAKLGLAGVVHPYVDSID